MHKSRAAQQRQHFGVSFDKMQISWRHDLVVIVLGNNGCHSVITAEPYKLFFVCVLCGFFHKKTNQYIRARLQPWRIVGVCIPKKKNRLIPRRQYAVSEDYVCRCVSMCVIWLCMCVSDDRAAVPRGTQTPIAITAEESWGTASLHWHSPCQHLSLSDNLAGDTHTNTHTHIINLSHSLPPSLRLSPSPRQNLATVFPHHTHSFPITRQVAAVPRQ